MNNNVLILKSIDDLIQKTNVNENISHFPFLVKSYQRGFKWETKEVEDLLNDINKFELGKNGEFYCLQPVVVKKVSDNGLDKWELIDGQQRLTTIYLILLYLQKNVYQIDYQTRTSSSDFLKNINDHGKYNKWETLIKKEKIFSNIDNYHFFQAFQTIKNWFINKDEQQKAEFLNKITKQTKVIWYEVRDDSSPIEIFTRINIGKIPLTNAELVKALFLSRINIESNLDEIHLKQLEIAQEWDKIEYSLQNNEFWYFLTNEDENKYSSRIEYIFNLMADELNKDYKIKKQSNEYYTYLVFNRHFEKNKKSEPDNSKVVDKIWNEVKKYFQTLKEWYDNTEMYHLIGYLIASGFSNIKNIVKEYHPDKDQPQITKSKFQEKLIDIINREFSNYSIEDFEYRSDKKKINDTLLLFNIQSIIKSNVNNRFPFDKYKTEGWSLEHIHAQNQDVLNSFESIQSYVKDFIEYVSTNIDSIKDSDEQKKFIEKNKTPENWCEHEKDLTDFASYKDKFNIFINEATILFPDQFNLHSIDNMALLSKKLNSKLNNGFFNEKREKIIEADKKGEFIPITTKNVFLKYYSKNTSNLYYWSQKDREDYLEEILKEISTDD